MVRRSLTDSTAVDLWLQQSTASGTDPLSHGVHIG
jgi:hypothetical protein